jgi:flagellin-like protein
MHNKKSLRTRRLGRAKHGRRAVSEIVATLIMLAVVASLGVLVFTFATSGLGSLSQSFTSLMGGSGDAISEKFVVEQVTFTTSGGSQGADVYVRNVGTISATLVSVYIVDQTSGTFVSQFTISTAVNVGTFVDVPHATLIFTPAHGHAYSFTVTTSRGNSVIYNAKAT